MSQPFELLLFSTDPAVVRAAGAAGVAGFVVDWECQGKPERQRAADTQINHDTPEDLRRVRAATDRIVICRINGFGAATPIEVEQAVAAGADEILLPMVRHPREVERLLELVRGRARVGILVETLEAVARAEVLAALPLARAYLGLNDLAIERASPHIFAAVLDGTVESVRRAFRVPFGFGGLTLPEAGDLVPCRLLIGEMARLGCGFSFLRRSFHRDLRGRRLSDEVPRILEAIEAARGRPPAALAKDRRELESLLSALGAAESWAATPEP